MEKNCAQKRLYECDTVDRCEKSCSVIQVGPYFRSWTPPFFKYVSECLRIDIKSPKIYIVSDSLTTLLTLLKLHCT